MSVYLAALLIGIVAGLRTLTAPAAVSWAARLGWLHLDGSWLEFLGWTWTPIVLTVLAIGEFYGDQLPSMQSRTVPVQFGARIVSGALAGAAIGVSGGNLLAGLAAGVVGAVLGTLGGARARAALARSLGHDRPAALCEDCVAVAAAALIMVALR